jgi:predicted ATP-grasp superfamily ATP-dependent carboligase
MSRSIRSNDKPRETVLLLGNYRPTLTLARVLSGKGYRIISGLEGHEGGAEYSRFVNQIWDHPHLRADPDKFAGALREFVEANDVSIIFPVSEEFVRFFSDAQYSCPKHSTVAMVDPKLVRKCLNKIYMLDLATKNQVPTASYAIAKSLVQLYEVGNRIGYPLVVRPEDSTQRLDGKKALFVADEHDLKRQLPDWSATDCGLVLQKKSTGRRHNIYFAARHGRLHRYVHAVILRTDNPDGSGLAVDGLTIAQDPELRDYTERLVEALDYTGVGCAQYLVDKQSGQVNFLEINARIAGNHAVPERAGLDLSAFLIDLAAGREIDANVIDGETSIRYVWTSGDIDAAKIAWMRSEIGHVDAIIWVLRAVWSAIRADLHMTFTWSDPKPGLMALKRLLPSINKLATHIRQRRQHGSVVKTDPTHAKTQR